MLRNLSSFAAYLNWVWDFLIHLSFYRHRLTVSLVPENSRFREDGRSTEPVECVVCLSNIEEYDEIRVLRCKHLFHKECLDRCVEYRHTTCPLCRDYLAGPRMVCELGRELIVLSFCGSNDDDFERWWLR
ncbi:Zinc finger, RING/FYVE/PHD-type [Cynara cardunculus var. scolymus]|uniref:Zinc finger, RING/FYVE/PHD-type n=1 Tax=Cynara cardunculus var. scolymus TaxID=59895 RepID=A0A118JWQ5_CYNCS|nr:Zinc finger, RING/FYVE/PHD-type [Cynara cardunculus var. scolymus]